MTSRESLRIETLLAGYRAGAFSVTEIVEQVLAAAEAAAHHAVWITRLPRDHVLRYVRALDGPAGKDRPLYGIPFVIKDNIDLAGVPTTAACPDFAYTPQHSAPVVQRLIDQGAIPLGKTNLDQFATGLNGTRSPYGACRNSFNTDFISGGSSAGSAVAVALGLASFSLGTDTAGSGRVPAAFNNLVGLKPSLGRLSTRGVVPACRSLDCVSIFALTAEDAGAVLDAAEEFDPSDPYASRRGNTPLPGAPLAPGAPPVLRVGVPRPDQLEFFGDADYAHAFGAAVQRLAALDGVRLVPVDLAPFLDAARLLYDGPWVAERYAAVGRFMEAHPASLFPVTAAVIAAGRTPSAVSAFEGQYRLRALQRATENTWEAVDVLVTPTAPSIYTVAQLQANPIELNSRLGYYTNFINLLDLVGIAVPAGFRPDGLPFGVTLVAPAATERSLLPIAGRLHRASVSTVGALAVPLVAPRPPPAPAHSPATPRSPGPAADPRPDSLLLAVCGAHMDALPLNHQLRALGATLVRRLRTAPHYRLYALAGGPPQRPGLVRVAQGGAAIEVEVWVLPATQVGAFIRTIPAPLGIGQIDLEDGSRVQGFLCEAYAAAGATDITAFGGWRAFQSAQSGSPPR